MKFFPHKHFIYLHNNVQSLVEFEAEYERRGREGGYNTITHGIRLYDGLWALGFALNRTMTMVNSGDISQTICQNASGSLVPLHQFTYSNELMGCLIQWSLQATNFSGLTVRSISFRSQHNEHSLCHN